LPQRRRDCFVLWQWLKPSGQVRRNHAFTKYINKLQTIEGRILAIEQGDASLVSELLALQDEVCALKARAMDEFAHEDMVVKQLLFVFVAEANHAREQVTRLMQRATEGTQPLSDEARAL
jgi:hypothetical protein